MSGWFLLLLCFIEIPVFNASSVDPDQMLHSASSDLGLHCLPITLLGVSTVWGFQTKNGLYSDTTTPSHLNKSIFDNLLKCLKIAANSVGLIRC